MKTRKILCIVAGLLILASAAMAEKQKRTAIITDTAGVTTEVKDMEFSIDCRRYCLDLCIGAGVVVQSEILQIAIPLSNLVSLTQKGNTVVVAYLWRGKQLTAEGKIISEKMDGKSSLGDFKMKTDRIKTLQFKEPPRQTTDWVQTKPLTKANLKLADGTSMTVVGLNRTVNYYSTDGYIMGGETSTVAWPNIPFMRGALTAKVNMEDLAKVDFDGDGVVTIVLRMGTTESGKLSSGREGIDGFCGTCEKGHFFISLKHVKTIDFSKGSSKYK